MVASKSNVPAFIVNAVATLLIKFAELPWKLKSPLPLIKIPSEVRFAGKVSPIAIVPPLVPTNLIPPFASASCPKLIDACVDDIATSVASNSKLLTSISIPLPAILPPVNNTCEPLISPLGVTWKFDEEIKYVASEAPSKWNELPCFNFVESIVNPAILPPVNNTAEPVTSPSCLTLKFEDDININLLWSVPPSAGEPLIKI